MSVSRIIYAAANAPLMTIGASGNCRLCGLNGDGIPFEKWVKDTFTNFDSLQAGTIICQACQFCISETCPGLQERRGSDKPQKFRNYSHFVLDGVWYPLSKGDKPQMRTLLVQNPDVAIIAESGQKHLFFRLPVGWWQFEEHTMRPVSRYELLSHLADIEALYHGGFSKDEIRTGRYIQQRIKQFGLLAWKSLEDSIAGYRGYPICNLALFLAQKPEGETNGSTTTRHEPVSSSNESTHPDLARDTTGLQTEICQKHLGAIREPDQKRGVHQHGFDFSE